MKLPFSSLSPCVSVCLCVCAHACAQSCPALCDLRDCSPLGSSVYGIFQARILEWGAISSSRAFILSHQSHETEDDALSFFKPGCKQPLTAKPSSPWWAIRCRAHQRGWSTLGTAVHRSELLPACSGNSWHWSVHSSLFMSGSNQIWRCCRIVFLVPLQPRGDCVLFLRCSFLIIRALGLSDASEEGLRSPRTNSWMTQQCLLFSWACGSRRYPDRCYPNTLSWKDAVSRELYSTAPW